MKQYDVSEFTRILKRNGYTPIRCKGSHQTWQKDNNHITIPKVKLHSVIAMRLIKEYDLI